MRRFIRSWDGNPDESDHEHPDVLFVHHHRPPWARPGMHRFGPRRGGPGRAFRAPFGGGGPFGRDPFDEDEGRPRRQRRGDIKFAILEVLAEQPRHGYEVIKELENRYGGFYRPSPGSVYPTLQLLEDEGHLVGEAADGKKVYSVTDSGRKLLEEWQQQRGEGDNHWRRGFGGPGGRPELHVLRERVGGLITSVMEIARHGTPEQIQAAQTLLDNTRRELYAILAKQGGEDTTKL